MYIIFTRTQLKINRLRIVCTYLECIPVNNKKEMYNTIDYLYLQLIFV